MGKMTSDEIVMELIDLKIKQGKTHIYLIKYLKEKYGYANTFAYELINRATEKIVEIHRETTKNVLETRIQEYEQQRDEALASGDKRFWAMLTVELNKLQTLYIEKFELKQTIIEVKVREDEQDND